ncbi:15291_t:CDS:2, partial [Funneliformis mosseae]
AIVEVYVKRYPFNFNIKSFTLLISFSPLNADSFTLGSTNEEICDDSSKIMVDQYTNRLVTSGISDEKWNKTYKTAKYLACINANDPLLIVKEMNNKRENCQSYLRDCLQFKAQFNEEE